MSEIWLLIWPIFAGLLLGIIFFGGLWWTVRKGLKSTQPALWFMISLMMRTGITISGFYFIGGQSWQKLVLMLIGFIISRWGISYLTR